MEFLVLFHDAAPKGYVRGLSSSQNSANYLNSINYARPRRVSAVSVMIIPDGAARFDKS